MVSISTLRRDAKQEANTAKKNIIRNICTRLKNIREENKGSVKHGLISTIIKTIVQAVPQYNITRHSIRHMQLKMAKEAKKDILKPSAISRIHRSPFHHHHHFANWVDDQKGLPLPKPTIN